MHVCRQCPGVGQVAPQPGIHSGTHSHTHTMQPFSYHCLVGLCRGWWAGTPQGFSEPDRV